MTTETDAGNGESIRKLIHQGNAAGALRLARQLAASGSRDGQLLLAWMYHTGVGVPPSLEEAESLYLQAAGAGSANAMFNLAVLHGQKNEAAARLDWLKRASLEGHAGATYRLGRIYLFGTGGVAKDRELGLSYLNSASIHGHILARSTIARDMLAGKQGLARVPLGLVKTLLSLWAIARTGWKTPESESLI